MDNAAKTPEKTDGRARPDGDAPVAARERPTLKTIAFMTGLGITTVSRALKDAPDIGAETKRRVRLVADKVGYRPNRAGVRLRTGKTNVISLILNTHEEIMGITSNMVYGISEILADTHYHLVVTPYSHSRDPMEPVRYVLETGSADGVIISRTEPDDARVRFLMDNNFPFATHGRTEMGLDHPFHDFDNYAFARQSVFRLGEKGRARLALLAPPASLTFYRHMMDGFLNAVDELGLSEVSLAGLDIDRTLAEIKAGAERIMKTRHRPDGIICGSGASAIAIVAGVESAGLTIGRDIDIYSKQSTPILPWFRSEIGVFDEDVREAGRELARSVLGHIEGEPVASLQSIMKPA